MLIFLVLFISVSIILKVLPASGSTGWRLTLVMGMADARKLRLALFNRRGGSAWTKHRALA